MNKTLWNTQVVEKQYSCKYKSDRTITLADCFSSEQEHKQALDSLVTFSALRISAELIYSWPEHTIKRAVTKTDLFPNLLFARSRYFNLSQTREEHELRILKMLVW